MDLPITKEEFDEIVEALCKEHWDYNKRKFRQNLYEKMKLIQELHQQGLPYKKILREEYGMVA